MKNDTENVVDLRAYRRRPTRAPLRSSTQSNISPQRPIFVALPIPFLMPIPIPVMWFPW
jgi:hypothetical protein